MDTATLDLFFGEEVNITIEGSSTGDSSFCSSDKICCRLSAYALSWSDGYELDIFSFTISFILFLMMFFMIIKLHMSYVNLIKRRFNRNISSMSEFFEGNGSPYSDEESRSSSSSTISNVSVNASRSGSAYSQIADSRNESVGHESSISRPVYFPPVYYTYLMIAAFWFLVQSVFFLLPKSNASIVIETFLFSGHAIIDNGLLVFAYFDVLNRGAVITAITICFSLYIVLAAYSLYFTLQEDCLECSIVAPSPQSFYIYAVMFLIYVGYLCLMYSKMRRRPRTTIRYWVLYLISFYFLASIGTGLVTFGTYAPGFCIVNITSLLYAILYGPMFYYSVKRDSAYFRDVVQDEQIHLLIGQYKRRRNTRKKAVSAATIHSRTNALLQQFPLMPFIDYEELEFGPRLGVGAAGEVHLAHYHKTPVAVKRLFESTTHALDDFFKEIILMSRLSHPNIVLFMGVSLNETGDRFIIMEMMKKGSVFDILHPNLSHCAIRGDPDEDKELTPKRVRRILKHTARGMSYLHSLKSPIIHRDLKTHNLLIDDHWRVKITDFGLSRPKSNNTMTAAGTPQWSAPEVIRREHYTEKADVYSFGIIIYELLTKEIPYANMGALTAAHRVAFDGLRPEFPEEVDERYAQLARLCWSLEPADRPTFQEIANFIEEFPLPRLVPDEILRQNRMKYLPKL